MTEFIVNLLQDVPVNLRIVLLSAIPLTELRISIPFALYIGMEPVKAFGLAVLGNILPVMPILVLLDPVVKLLEGIPLFNGFYKWLFTRTRRKGGDLKKYGLLGLTLFVALPLPGTGAWSGALLAFLFGMPIGASFLAISFGVVLAGGIVTLAGLGALELIFHFNFQYLVVVLVILCFWWYCQKKRKN